MYAPVSPTPSAAVAPSSVISLGRASSSDSPFQTRQPDPFVRLVRNHHRSIFHIAHALLRDEVVAEKITQQVFSRARKRMSDDPASVIEWIYYASFRFVRMYHWRSVGLIARRRMRRTLFSHQPELDLKKFVQVIALQPGKIDPRDCELLALRHVLGMPLATIAQLLRMHPYEVSNRLAWAFERVGRLSRPAPLEIEKPAELALSA
jgi:DNA-directed RNA polymerase specialized sigma24 family protein